MRNITFTEKKQEILGRTKWLTARYWITDYGRQFIEGEYVTLSTGRKRETRFAVAEIKRVVQWDGHYTQDSEGVNEPLDMTRQEVAEAEGFTNWGAFFQKYRQLNQHHLDNPYEVNRRSHFFIEFEVVEVLP